MAWIWNFTRRNLPCKIVTPGLLSGLVFFTFFPPWLLSCPGLVFSKFFLSNWTINHAVVTSHQCKTRRSILFLARGSFWFVGSKEKKYYDFVNMQRLLCQTYKYYLYFLLLFEIFRPSGRVRGCLHLQAQRVWLENTHERDFLRRKKYHQVIYCVSYSSQTPHSGFVTYKVGYSQCNAKWVWIHVLGVGYWGNLNWLHFINCRPHNLVLCKCNLTIS